MDKKMVAAELERIAKSIAGGYMEDSDVLVMADKLVLLEKRLIEMSGELSEYASESQRLDRYLGHDIRNAQLVVLEAAKVVSSAVVSARDYVAGH